MSDTTEIVADLLAGAMVFEREGMSHTSDTMRKAAARLVDLDAALDVAAPPPYKYTDASGTWQRTGHGGSANSRTFQYHRVHGT